MKASPSKVQPLTCVSSNETASAVVDAPGDQLAERKTNHGGDENQTTIPKAGRPKATVDPGKAVEKAAKVGLSIFGTDHYRLFIEGERADR